MMTTDSIRDQVIEILDSNDPEGGVYDPGELEDFWGAQADALLSSSLIRRIQAEAWAEGQHAGWCEGYSHGEPAENPYL